MAPPGYGPASPESPTGSNRDLNSQSHKRVYQACIPCRRRKVRCDLGSVDDPHDPPCVRCRRESKECFFSATRRKRKTDDGFDVDEDEYTIRNGRKRLRASATPPPTAHSDPEPYEPSAVDIDEGPRTPGGSYGRRQPLRRPDGRERSETLGPGSGQMGYDGDGDGDGNQTLENYEAQTVMRRGVFGPHDALDLLYKAATDRSVTRFQKVPELTRPSPAATRPESNTPATSIPPQKAPEMRRPRTPAPVKPEQPIDPGLSQANDVTAQPGYAEAVKAWTRFRFVRAGWFTAAEAIQYID